MKDLNELSRIYREIWIIHKKIFPDLRIGQLFSNFFEWITDTQEKDPYYITEEQLLHYLAEYATEMNKKS